MLFEKVGDGVHVTAFLVVLCIIVKMCKNMITCMVHCYVAPAGPALAAAGAAASRREEKAGATHDCHTNYIYSTK